MSCGHIIDHYLRESIKEEINPRCQKKKNLKPSKWNKENMRKTLQLIYKIVFFPFKRPTKYVKSSNSDEAKMKRDRNAHFLES